MIGSLLLAYALPLCAGACLVQAGWPRTGGDRSALVMKACLAIGLGLGLSACAFFIAIVVWRPTRPAAVIADVVLLGTSAAVLLTRWARNRAVDGRRRVAREATGWGRRALVVCLGVVALSAGTAMVWKATITPHGENDAWAIWNLRARFLFRGGDHWRDGLSSLIGWSHPDYPLLVPGAVARAWLYVGRETVTVPIALAMLFTVATVGLGGSAVGFLRGATAGLVASLLLLGTPVLVEHGMWQYADVPLAFFILASVALLCVAERRPRDRSGLACLAGLALGLAAWTKNEGSLLVVAVFVACVVRVASLRDRHTFLSSYAPVLIGLAPLLIMLLYYRVSIAPPNDLLQGQGFRATGERMLTFARYGLIARAFVKEIIDFGGAVVSLPVGMAVYAMLAGTKIEEDDRTWIRTTILVLTLMLAGYFAVYVVTPQRLEWHLMTSLRRVLLQLWPSCVFVYCLVIRTPTED